MPSTPESASAASAKRTLEPSAARAEQRPEVEEAVGREEQIWQALQIRAQGGKDQSWHQHWRDRGRRTGPRDAARIDPRALERDTKCQLLLVSGAAIGVTTGLARCH